MQYAEVAAQARQLPQLAKENKQPAAGHGKGPDLHVHKKVRPKHPGMDVAALKGVPHVDTGRLKAGRAFLLCQAADQML